MKLYNGWGPQKQSDKFEILLRVSIFTIFELSYDISSNKFKFVILNLGIKN